MELSKLKELNGVSLAYLGDAIWELKVREFFVNRNYLVKKLHKQTVKYTNAKKQSEIIEKEMDNLDEQAYNFTKRGKNSNVKSFPKSCTRKEYKNSTAFEALIGYYYLSDKIEKIDDLISKYLNR